MWSSFWLFICCRLLRFDVVLFLLLLRLRLDFTDPASRSEQGLVFGSNVSLDIITPFHSVRLKLHQHRRSSESELSSNISSLYFISELERDRLVFGRILSLRPEQVIRTDHGGCDREHDTASIFTAIHLDDGPLVLGVDVDFLVDGDGIDRIQRAVDMLNVDHFASDRIMKSMVILRCQSGNGKRSSFIFLEVHFGVRSQQVLQRKAGAFDPNRGGIEYRVPNHHPAVRWRYDDTLILGLGQRATFIDLHTASKEVVEGFVL